MKNITKSSRAQESNGNGIQPLAPAAAVQLEIVAEKPSFNEDGMILLAMLESFLRETYNPDVVDMALHRARTQCLSQGVKSTQFERVSQIVNDRWVQLMKRNPMYRAFWAS